MGQKTHPLCFRIGITQQHRSVWFANSKHYAALLEEDYQIRHYITKQLKNSGIASIQIYKKVDQIEIEIKTARPGIILGRSGIGIQMLRQKLQNILGSNKQIRINVIEIIEPDREAALIAEFIAQQIEKRVTFRRAIRQATQRIQKTDVQGVKIQVSGRLNGAEIARREWIREGRVPLQTLRANIDYSHKIAFTTYGILGIKVWLFTGESVP